MALGTDAALVHNCGGAAKAGVRLGDSPTLEAGGRSFIYGDRVLNRAKEAADLNHNFPSSLDREILTHGTRTEVSYGYVEYTLPGKINGRSGVYEIGTRPSGLANGEVIKHRFFNPNRTP